MARPLPHTILLSVSVEHCQPTSPFLSVDQARRRVLDRAMKGATETFWALMAETRSLAVSEEIEIFVILCTMYVDLSSFWVKRTTLGV